MAFIPIINKRGPAINRHPVIRVALHQPAYGQNAATIKFTLNWAIMRMMGWRTGFRVVVSFGVAEDIGKISISRVESGTQGYKLLNCGGSGTEIRLRLPVTIGDIESAAILSGMELPASPPFEAIDGALVLTPPKPRIRVVASNAAA